MPGSTQSEFEKKAPKLIKLLTDKLTFLNPTEGNTENVSRLLNEARDTLSQDAAKAYDKAQEANGYLIQVLRPLANKLLKIELFYLAVWLIIAYLTVKYPDYWLWSGILGQGATAVWYGVLGGITIGIFGIYNHIRRGDFDPRFRLWYICKPIIGGIFGWLVYGSYFIGFVTIQGKANVDIAKPFFVYILAFLAGFSERFILRMIDKIMAVITTYDAAETDKKDETE